jgi:hypothetical protein
VCARVCGDWGCARARNTSRREDRRIPTAAAHWCAPLRMIPFSWPNPWLPAHAGARTLMREPLKLADAAPSARPPSTSRERRWPVDGPSMARLAKNWESAALSCFFTLPLSLSLSLSLSLKHARTHARTHTHTQCAHSRTKSKKYADASPLDSSLQRCSEPMRDSQRE